MGIAGFSYSNTSTDYVVGDDRSAEDVYHALQQFVLAYPAYAKR